MNALGGNLSESAGTTTTEHRRGLDVPRRLGEYQGNLPGRTLVVLGGIHGNEPAGIHAIRNVLAHLETIQPPFRGRLIGLSGNRRGLRGGLRYLDKDLNRLWKIEDVKRDHSPDCAERAEFLALKSELWSIIQEDQQPIVLVDMHTFSADGPPFTISDAVETNSLLAGMPLPLVMGLTHLLPGTLSHCLSEMGHISMAVEGGQHDDPMAEANLRLFLWLLMIRGGLIDDQYAPTDIESEWDRLASANEDLPRAVHIHYRHRITTKSQFVMNPGYRNFDPIREGQPLARDRNGTIHAPTDGCILMPLYQGQGSDGFFVGVSEFYG